MDPITFQRQALPREESKTIEPTTVANQRKKIFCRAKEAEDKYTPARVITRRSSAHQLKRAEAELTKEEEIRNRSGVLWECIDRIPNKLGGFIYKFRLRDEYDDVRLNNKDKANSKLSEIFPAIERPGSALLDYTLDNKYELAINHLTRHLKELRSHEFQSTNFDLLRQKSILIAEVFLELKMLVNALGYKFENNSYGFFTYLPDREAFTVLNKEFSEKNPGFPILDILPSTGVASDLDFAEAFINHDGILSNGLEFCHDHMSHLMNLIGLVKESLEPSNKDYKSVRAEAAKEALKGYKRIMITERAIQDGLIEKEKFAGPLKKFQAALGAFADSTSTNNNYYLFKNNVLDHFLVYTCVWDSPAWKNYWKRRFGEIDSAKLGELWDELGEIEKEFDKLHSLNKKLTV